MSKTLTHTKLSPTLALSECTDGFWLWDQTRGMNLSMRAKSSNDAFVEALHYYQRRLSEVEQAYKELSTKVDAFVSQVRPEDVDE